MGNVFVIAELEGFLRYRAKDLLLGTYYLYLYVTSLASWKVFEGGIRKKIDREFILNPVETKLGLHSLRAIRL